MPLTVLPWIYCTDVLVEILLFSDPIPTVVSLMKTSTAISCHLKQDSVLWKHLSTLNSCPICFSDFVYLRGRYSVQDAEYWYTACKISVASKSLRSQWGVRFSSRAFLDLNHSSGNRSTLLTAHRIRPAKPEEAPVVESLTVQRISIIAHLSSFLTRKVNNVVSSLTEGGVYLCGEDENFADIAPMSELYRAPFEEVQVLLSRFLILESGVLFSEDSFYLHKHELMHASTYRAANMRDKKIGVERRLDHVRNRPWQEVSVSPASNPFRLPVLSPFVGKDNGKKREMRALTRSMYNASGAGSAVAAPIRWFFAKVLAIESNLSSIRYREVLLAVSFSHPVVIDSAKDSGHLRHRPNVARIVGVSHRTSTTFSWLGESIEQIMQTDAQEPGFRIRRR